MGRRVAHFLHRQADAAGFFIETLVATAIGRLADAGNEGKGPFQHANDLANRDIARFSCEHVSTAASKLALQQTMTGQFEEDRFEKLLRQTLTIGKLLRLDRPLPGVLCGELQHRLQTVLRLLREH